MFVAAFTLALSLVSTVSAVTTCNVLNYGAVANNETDVGPAITKAYNDCVKPVGSGSISNVVLLIPSGNFLMNSTVTIDDASYMTFTITGNIYLPFNPDLSGTMIEFEVPIPALR
jgi:rhamnogalacturonan hydrolase